MAQSRSTATINVMTTDQNKKWGPVIAIAAALAIWGIVLALGAYLAPVGEANGHDGRKLLVVAATVGSFLLLWAAILAISAAKLRRRKIHQESLSDSAPRDDTSR